MVEKTKETLLVLTGRDLKIFEAGEDVGWNAAIEAAAKKADECGYEPIGEVIRDLKK